MAQPPSNNHPSLPPRRLRSPGYAVEPAAIEVMLDQPSVPLQPTKPKVGRGGTAALGPLSDDELTARNVEGDLREVKTCATTSTADTSSPVHTKAVSTEAQNSAKRISFRDRFMKRKAPVAAKRPPSTTLEQAPTSAAKAVPTTKASKVSPACSTDAEGSQRARTATTLGRGPATSRGRSPSARKVARNTQRGSTLSPPRLGASQPSPPQVKRERGKSLSRARLLMKRTICAPKAIDEEYEATQRGALVSSPRGVVSSFPTSSQSLSLVSPHQSPPVLYSALDSGAIETSPLYPMSPMATSRAEATTGRTSTDVAFSPYGYTHESKVDEKSSRRVGKARGGLVDDVEPAQPAVKNRRPSSIQVVRGTSHVSELSLPMLPHHPKGRQGSALGDQSVAAVRNILSQVEEELNRGVSRDDILARLKGLSETLEREARESHPGHVADEFEAPATATHLVDEVSQAAEPVDYEKALLELRKRSLGLRQGSRSTNPGDAEDSFATEDESSGVTGDGAGEDDHSEFTKWLEEIENEEGGIAQDSINFLMGLFNFQSLMIVKKEDDEADASSSRSFSEDSSVPFHTATSFKAVSTTGSNFWTNLPQQSSKDPDVDFFSNSWRTEPDRDDTNGSTRFVPATPSGSEDDNDDTLSLSSIESNQYSKQSRTKSSVGDKRTVATSAASTSRAIASSTIVMYPRSTGPGKSTTKSTGTTGSVDYDAMWDSSRRGRSRSFRGAFRSRSRGRNKHK